MPNKQENGVDEIDEFFIQYLGFAYDRQQPVYVEFYRMCCIFGWHIQPDGQYPVARQQAWELFRIAIVQAFNSQFGADQNSLASWQRICHCLGIIPVPESLHEARQVKLFALLKAHIL
ncbi:hypothetical protein N7468_000627 [Penicillium chermesinum]|uniref:Uncharacterized protein n=1 Tax=Penicillium chermesinum TaxID=63820 RepID=A0A9W9PKN8_9EURO|nr:uncharacterized protein N7468_000627 [Penicillium chermesinum]KAJ5249176.1 hypothetical protein N7468_000627 [Penicillium chermesinum]